MRIQNHPVKQSYIFTSKKDPKVCNNRTLGEIEREDSYKRTLLPVLNEVKFNPLLNKLCGSG